MDDTKVRWRVQVRPRHGKWQNRGLFETREMARARAVELRGAKYWDTSIGGWSPIGLRNTRVTRFTKE